MSGGVLRTMLWSRWQGTGGPSAILQHIISKYSQYLPQPFRVTTTGTETGRDLQFWLLSFARSQKFLSSFLAGSEECQKGSALTSCYLSSPFTPPRWKPLPGSYLQGHDQVWEALGHPMGGVTGLTNPPLSASSQLLPNVSSKTPRLATCWQPISWDSVYAGPLLLISLVVTHNLTIKSHSKCSLLLSGKIILGPWETKDWEAIVFGWLC